MKEGFAEMKKEIETLGEKIDVVEEKVDAISASRQGDDKGKGGGGIFDDDDSNDDDDNDSNDDGDNGGDDGDGGKSDDGDDGDDDGDSGKSSGDGGGSPGKTPKSIPDRWVNAHNYWRCIHGAPPIKWDKDFARGAQKWADKGQFSHADCYNIPPPQGPAGENLAGGSSMTP